MSPRSDDEEAPELAPSPSNFHTTPAGGCLAVMYDLMRDRPHTRRIFSGIVFRTWNPPAPKPGPCHNAKVALIYSDGDRVLTFLNMRRYFLPCHNATVVLIYSDGDIVLTFLNLRRYFLPFHNATVVLIYSDDDIFLTFLNMRKYFLPCQYATVALFIAMVTKF
ncbi:hypothetical protein AVEN_52512-1 [Araneus ventricosus]|uniref:Uncharacterized protein n=1 Tax=Araneus ventricosus TaxID=182803 RepID=A0A4Y2UAM4_ARAVE|nr:hypothetical protein AVEN_52512-1 [Araneus ventricosus]